MSAAPNTITGRRKRMAVARFWFEGNAFCPLPADMAAFERREWRRGDDALDAARGTATELGAVAVFADRHPEWDVVVLRCASALPAGPIADTVFDRFTKELRDDLSDGGWDAVYLSLHGAAITRTHCDPDLRIARMVRELLPGVPIGASFDLHGNMSPEFAGLLDMASVYRTHPHIDMRETAMRVLEALARCAAGELSTRRFLLNEGVLLQSHNMRTDAGPMREIEEAARAATNGAVIEVAVFGGFPYADTPNTAASVFVVSDARLDLDGSAARAAAQAVMATVRRLEPAFDVRLPGPAEAVAAALALPEEGLVAVTDPGDNPLSGGGGDTPGLLRALLDARPGVPCVFASFADRAVVADATAAGIGARLTVTLGARYGTQFGAGVTFDATVVHVSDGVFRNAGPMEAGVETRSEGSVVLRVAGLPSTRVVVTGKVVPADDPAFYASNGIDLARVRLLCAKAKNHFRAAFAQRCVRIIDCDAPGPSCLDLSQLPVRHLKLKHS